MFNKCVCTEILGVFEFTRSECGIFRTNGRDFCSISMRKVGSTDFDGQKLNPYELIFIPDGVSYSQITAGYEEVICAHFRLKGAYDKALTVIKGDHTVAVKNLLCAWKNGEYARSMSFLYRILADFNTLSGFASIADKAQKIADENMFSCGLTVSGIANGLGVSVQYLRRKYKEKYGNTISDYIIEKRLETAREFLLSGYFTVSETAEKCGFSDAKYFSRAFSKKYGAPPSKIKFTS